MTDDPQPVHIVRVQSSNMRSVVQCLQCGQLAERSRSGRCTDCARTKDRARQAKRGDRYGADYQRVRAGWAELLNAGVPTMCARCEMPLQPGDLWHLDHVDGGLRPSHPQCNSGAHR